MSDEPEDEESGSPERWRLGDILVRVVLPAAILSVVMAVFFGERLTVDHEVQLVVPRAAAPGDSLPVRALVFGGVTTEMPHLVPVPVEVRLRPWGQEEVVLEETLGESPAGGSEAVLTLPPELEGAYRLQAIARGPEGEAVASVEAPITVEASPPLAPVQGRVAGALQRLSLGEIVTEGEATPPDSLDARVVGAACVPEAPCTLLVHVGAPAASIRVTTTPSVEMLGEPGPPTEGIARVTVTTHGPEAVTELEALRDGVVVARRPMQVPTALATPGLSLASRIIDEGDEIAMDVNVLTDRPGIIVDAYRGGRWRQTASFTRDRESFTLPFALSEGEWTLEVRTDPFSAERAAVRRIAVGALPEDVAAAPPGTDEDRMAWASADHEVRVHRRPEGVRGLPQDLAKLQRRQGLLRTAALAAIVLGLIVLGAVFMRRAVDATVEAQAVMAATGDPELASRRHRRRTLLSSLAIVATVLIAFVGAAALVIARAHLLE